MDPQSTESLVNQSVANNESHTPVRTQVIGDPVKRNIPFKKIGFILLALFLLIFGGKFLFENDILSKIISPPTPTPTSTPPLSPTITPVQTSTILLLPGKEYYNDTLSILTKDDTRKAILASVTRAEQETTYQQYTSLKYFDGSSWSESTVTNTTNQQSVSNNIIVREWSSSSTDPAGKGVSFVLMIGNSQVMLQTDAFQSEISLVSLPEYTKLVSQGTGKVTINEKEYEAFFTYTRSYSVNAALLSYLNDPKSVEMKSLSVWDESGQFYMIDILKSANSANKSRDYTVGAIQDQRSIQRATSVNMSDLKEAGKYSATLNNYSLNLLLLTSTKKGEDEVYTQLTGLPTGTILLPNNSSSAKRSLQLVGFLEDISKEE